MIDRVAAFITGEGNWLPVAMAVAGATVLLVWLRRKGTPHRDRVQEAMNLFVGVTLMVMGTGHLLAVGTKQWQGTLNGAPLLLYPIGAAVLIPAALIVSNANRPRAATMNGWMAAILVVLGLVNIPLAIPALLNVAYGKHSRRGVGWGIVAASVVINLGLFAGGVMFMLSGARTFEEFSNMM